MRHDYKLIKSLCLNNMGWMEEVSNKNINVEFIYATMIVI